MSIPRTCRCLIVTALVACGAPAGGGKQPAWFEDVGSDRAAAADAAGDSTTADSATADSATADTTKPAFDPGPAPTGRLWPIAGELTLLHVGLDSLLPKMGEATIVVGPDGTLVLIDVGNDKHAKQIRALVETLNTTWLVPARGFPARAKRQVEWVLLTHFHADHGGGLADLLKGSDALDLKGGVVHRGWVDVGDGTTAGTFEPLCAALQGKALDRPLCAPATLPVCDLSKLSSHHPATSCAGLRRGRLDDASDDASGAATYLALGGGARLTLLAADGWLGGATLDPAPPMGYDDSNQENARSVVGLLEHGAFRAHFGGDLTGSGAATEPDVESRLVAHVGGAFWGERGVDVAKAHHHARKTSNNATLVAALAPADGRDRNVVGGISKLHLGSPHDEVVARWSGGGRLGQGRFWLTFTTVGGAKAADFPALVVGDGDVVVRTVQGGDGYWMQAPALGLALPFASVRR